MKTLDDLNVLLVEDDEVDVMNVKRAFKKANITYPLHVAHNGLEALEALKQANVINNPKVILLDINMPKMNGIEFLTELRKDPIMKNIPVFILTTSNEDADKFDAYNLNVAGYILKPLAFGDFMKKIEALAAFWKISEQI